ncbi:MAG: hypothetical protein HRU37_08300 [Roseibacillus sp.]|nr:hypothetical protein [Roseibacillus sp.]
MADHDEVELGAAYLEHCASLLESRAVDPESRRNLDDIYYVADLLNELKSDRRKLTITIRLCQQTRERSPLYLDTHSVALANVGRFQDAIATANKAIALIPPPNTSAIDGIRGRISLYAASKPYRESGWQMEDR